jgi:cell pole-organizing protein PopZ
MTDTVQEPPMEEILASIRRIISEDGERMEGKPVAAKEAEAEAEREPEKEEDDVLDPSDTTALEPNSLLEQLCSEEAKVPPTCPGPAPRLDDGLVSPSQAQETMESFSRLNEKLNEDYHELPIGNGAITLERLTRELMRPMLKEWLDQHLPVMVERLVREEMERLVGQSQRRDPW